MSLASAGLSLALGGLGGALHLQVTAWRARAAVRGKLRLAFALLPVAFAGPALAVLTAAMLAGTAAWLTIGGIWLVRFFCLAQRSVARDA